MTTIEQDVTEVRTALRDTLAAHKSMYLATVGSNGPWVGGVYFAESDPFTLELVLEDSGRTLAAIRANPEVAVVVSTGTPAEPFLQARATAEVIEGDEDSMIRARLQAKVPEVAPFLGFPIKTVRLTVSSWRVTDLVKGWLPGKEITPAA
ncbi:pyridoxamine 5'-phosphate oxidase family protein [Amycolatopsis sp. cg5]|uniref:pyridoxamine 5'-phosphate oxidase family protein n=1 Tax=Amycolatopsis sp. cg5 TaxID=3238802 RepID=UPI0035234140